MFEIATPTDTRKQNLQYLVNKFGQSNVAKWMAKPDRQLGDMLAGRKSFGEKVARAMELEWLKARNERIDLDSATMALDLEHLPETNNEAPAQRPAASRVPVAGSAQLGENGWYEEVQALGSEGYVETHSSDPDAYALRVRGDSMFPAIRDGWYVVVEPNGKASSGEYVAIALQDGRKMVKEYLFGNSESISVQSVNGGTRLTLSAAEILAVHPIGAVLMPSKHREI